MPQIDSKQLLQENLNKLLINQLEETVNCVHLKYKKYFKEEDVKKVLELMTNNISFNDMNSEDLDSMNQKITQKIIKRQVYNCGIYKNKHSIPEDNERCHSRIWANGYISKQESESNPENDSDKNNIDVNNSNKISFGKRCSRRINANCPYHKYCGHHMKNNPHGDYNTPLKKYQTKNFIKHSKLLNQSK
tara:strand:+ start:3878 stop:4447 length:570 start_codon:yes stop_codon:yes gene_type:complete